jgi:hypothetical protein
MVSVTAAAAALAPAHAHFGLADGDDVGSGLFWVYGIGIAALAAFLIYRKRNRNRETPEQRALKRRLGELERALTACLTQLQNVEDYPNECCLTHAERQERLVSASALREKIEEINGKLVIS